MNVHYIYVYIHIYMYTYMCVIDNANYFIFITPKKSACENIKNTVQDIYIYIHKIGLFHYITSSRDKVKVT